MHKKLIFGLIIMLAPLAGCGQESGPITGHAETYDRKHVEFGDGDLADRTRILAPTVTRDQAGLLHVDAQIRNTSDQNLHVDCFITFYRDGQQLEKIGPQTVILSANLTDDVVFNSTQPATDYMLTLKYPRSQ